MSASITFVAPPLGLGDAVEFSLRGVDGAASRTRATRPRVALTMWLITLPSGVNARTPTTVARRGVHIDA